MSRFLSFALFVLAVLAVGIFISRRTPRPTQWGAIDLTFTATRQFVLGGDALDSVAVSFCTREKYNTNSYSGDGVLSAQDTASATISLQPFITGDHGLFDELAGRGSNTRTICGLQQLAGMVASKPYMLTIDNDGQTSEFEITLTNNKLEVVARKLAEATSYAAASNTKTGDQNSAVMGKVSQGLPQNLLVVKFGRIPREGLSEEAEYAAYQDEDAMLVLVRRVLQNPQSEEHDPGELMLQRVNAKGKQELVSAFHNDKNFHYLNTLNNFTAANVYSEIKSEAPAAYRDSLEVFMLNSQGEISDVVNQ